MDLDALKQVIIPSLDNLAELQAGSQQESPTAKSINQLFNDVEEPDKKNIGNNHSNLFNSSKTTDKHSASLKLKTIDTESGKTLMITEKHNNDDKTESADIENLEFKNSDRNDLKDLPQSEEIKNIGDNSSQNLAVENLLLAMKSLPEQVLGSLTAAVQELSIKLEPEVVNKENKSDEKIVDASVETPAEASTKLEPEPEVVKEEVVKEQVVEDKQNDKKIELAIETSDKLIESELEEIKDKKSEENMNLFMKTSDEFKDTLEADKNLVEIESPVKKEIVVDRVSELVESESPDISKNEEAEVFYEAVRTFSKSEIKSDENEKINNVTPTVISPPPSRMNALKSLKNRLTSMISKFPSMKLGGYEKPEPVEANQFNDKESADLSLNSHPNSINNNNNINYHASNGINSNNNNDIFNDNIISPNSASFKNNSKTFKSSATITPINNEAVLNINGINKNNEAFINEAYSDDNKAGPAVVDNYKKEKEYQSPVFFQNTLSVAESRDVKRSTIYIEPLTVNRDRKIFDDFKSNVKVEVEVDGDQDLKMKETEVENNIKNLEFDQEINNVVEVNHFKEMDTGREIEEKNIEVNINNESRDDDLFDDASSAAETFELKITESPLLIFNDAAPVEEPPVVRGSLKINFSRFSETNEVISEPLKFASQKILENESVGPVIPLEDVLPKNFTASSMIEASIEINESAVKNDNIQSNFFIPKPIVKARAKSPVKRAFALRKLPTRKCFIGAKKNFAFGGVPKETAVSRAKECADKIAAKSLMSSVSVNQVKKLEVVDVNRKSECDKRPDLVSKIEKVEAEEKKMSFSIQKIGKVDIVNKPTPRSKLPSRIPVFRKKPWVAGQTISVASQKIIEVNVLRPTNSSFNVPRRTIPVLHPLATSPTDSKNKINNLNENNRISVNRNVKSQVSVEKVNGNSSFKSRDEGKLLKSNNASVQSKVTEKNTSRELIQSRDKKISHSINKSIDDELFRAKSSDDSSKNEVNECLELNEEYSEEEVEDEEEVEEIEEIEIEDDDSSEEEVEEEEEEIEEVEDLTDSETSDTNTKSSVIMRRINSSDELTNAELMLKKTLDDIKAEISDSECEQVSTDSSQRSVGSDEEVELSESNDLPEDSPELNDTKTDVDVESTIVLTLPKKRTTETENIDNSITQSTSETIKIKDSKVLKVEVSEPEVAVNKNNESRKRFSIVAEYVQQFEGETQKYERRNSKSKQQDSVKITREKSPVNEREVSSRVDILNVYIFFIGIFSTDRN